MFTILIVEDDKAIREMLTMFLSTQDYQVTAVATGKMALDYLYQKNPDVLLLDWMLPDINGVDLIPQIRKNAVHKTLPILMLTAKAEESDKIKGLNTGADDYMTKPVSLKELDARIRALIRRAHGLNQQQKLSLGLITLDPVKHEVEISNEIVKIGGMEYKLLHYFLKHPDHLHSRAQLLDSVWGQTVFIEERTVDVHIMRLRKILKKHHVDSMLETIRGMGYRFSTQNSPHNES